MNLSGKKIGIALSSNLLHDNKLLQEAEALMSRGAEIWLLLWEEEAQPTSGKEPFYINIEKKILNLMAARQRLESGAAFPGLDLLALVPSPASFLEKIKNYPHPALPYPLLLAPQGGLEILPVLSRIIFKNNIYLVPCGVLASMITYRVDLLAESCMAAIERQQLEPLFWEHSSLPY